jgi:phage tail sheath protein FI
MAQLKFGSAGVTAREIDLTGPVTQRPVGVPAGVIGTSLKGPAFVPITVGIVDDFYAKFGLTDGQKFGPLAVTEWLRNAQALTYLKVLGAGDGNQRSTQTGIVTDAGFSVGEQQPASYNDGSLSANPYANMTASNGGGAGPLGRTYFLGCFMSESAGSSVFSSPGLQTSSIAIPIVRGVLMAASGVILTLSASVTGVANNAPGSTAIATDSNGASLGDVVLLQNSIAKSDFVVLLNGHQGTNALYPNVITASFDMTSPNYFPNVMNTDPLKIQQAGHFVYASWDIYPVTAVVTGTGILPATLGAGALLTSSTPNHISGLELSSFLVTSSLARDVGSATVPDFEDFKDRFTHAKSPWVISQPFGGRAQNLFRVHALDDGAGVSTLYKLSIENIALSTDTSDTYPSFDLVVRSWSDNDAAPVYLEQWRGLSLNPSDDRFIAKVIGDQHAFFDFDRAPTGQKLVVEGNYPNASNYIRIEVDTSVDSGEVDPTAMPVGVRGPYHLVTQGAVPTPRDLFTSGAFTAGLFSGSLLSVLSGTNFGGTVVQPPLPLRQNITQGTGAKQQVNPLLYWGLQFEHVTSLTTPNLSTQPNKSLTAFAKHFPQHRLDVQNFVVGDNAGAADSAINGVLDSDRFNNNVFTLMNLSVVTSSVGTADPNQWVTASYVRDGNVVTDETAKRRRLQATDFTQTNRRFLKWTFMVQGGFDGVNIFDSDESKINGAAVDADMNATNRNANNGASVSAYTKALQIMGEVTNTDLQLLAIPGIRHPVVTDAAITAVESRFDALFIMDIAQIDNNAQSVTSDTQTPSVTLTSQNFAERALDTSFGAAYFPDVVIPDPNTKTNVVVPPSVVVLGAMALNDAVGHPWFAPAGFTRGSLQTTLEARVRLSKANMDTLYDVNINPLVAFPGNAQGGTNPKGGVVVWGQKTLQASASALDRVNVRRLLIEIRRQVRDIANNILFEPNRDVTLAKFSAAVTPRLQRIQALAGLERFRVIIDTSTTSQLDVENNTIRGKIYVQPTKTIEFVSLDFIVTNNLNQQQ